ncbi:Osmotin, thaumatin-like protein [Auriculariales sp. MPI-PUGE-AT-0066]|nr:Osmotin, thaumatin-like protein [Auriculariales sp. MPI-PUGE-AT-0066]
MFSSSASLRRSTFLLATAAAVSAGSRHFKIENKCSYTIWPAIYTPAGSSYPGIEGGWVAEPGSVREFDAQDNWTAGRIWARTGCNFDGGGQGSCLTGNCLGGLVCDQANGYGMAPATLAEFTFGQGVAGVDWYDVSAVDGTNVPMTIQVSNSCPSPDCAKDLNAQCPEALRGPTDANGKVLSCKSACVANLDGNPANSANCCTGDFAGRDKCTPQTVQFYDYFKGACPNSYAFALDEASGTAMWACDTNTAGVPDYSIVFCPAGDDGNGAPAAPEVSTSFTRASSRLTPITA